MAVVMRMRRMGGNQRPFYRLVVADSREPREGRFLEKLGDYNPMCVKDKVNLKPDRIEHWLKQGAVPSERVKQLLRSNGIKTAKITVKSSAAAKNIPSDAAKEKASKKKAKD